MRGVTECPIIILKLYCVWSDQLYATVYRCALKVPSVMHLPGEFEGVELADDCESGVGLDTLRLWMSDQQWLSLLERIARSSSDYLGPERRQTRKHRHSKTMRCLLRLGFPGTTPGTFMVRSRNISNDGIGFIHGCFIDPGTRCALAVQDDDGFSMMVSGRIAWCKRIDLEAYDVGVQFDQLIEVNRFGQEDPPPASAI